MTNLNDTFPKRSTRRPHATTIPNGFTKIATTQSLTTATSFVESIPKPLNPQIIKHHQPNTPNIITYTIIAKIPCQI